VETGEKVFSCLFSFRRSLQAASRFLHISFSLMCGNGFFVAGIPSPKKLSLLFFRRVIICQPKKKAHF
jgi:hypothetical protein